MPPMMPSFCQSYAHAAQGMQGPMQAESARSRVRGASSWAIYRAPILRAWVWCMGGVPWCGSERGRRHLMWPYMWLSCLSSVVRLIARRARHGLWQRNKEQPCGSDDHAERRTAVAYPALTCVPNTHVVGVALQAHGVEQRLGVRVTVTVTVMACPCATRAWGQIAHQRPASNSVKLVQSTRAPME